MQELKVEIAELEEKIRRNQAVIQQKKRDVGSVLVASAPAELNDSVLGEQSREIRELLSFEPARKKEIDLILEIEEQLKTLNQEIKEKKTAIAEQEKDTRQYLEEIGVAAYSAFAGDLERFAIYKELFAELDRLEDKARKAGEHKEKHESGEKANENIFGQFIRMAKNKYYEKREDFFINRQQGAFKNAGRQVLDSDFVRVADDAVLNEKVQPVIDIHSRIKALEDELGSLEHKVEELNEDLAELGVRNNAARRIKEMEKEIEEYRLTIDRKYLELGKNFLDHARELSFEVQEVNNIVAAIQGLESENEDSRKQIVKLNARIEIRKIRQKISRNTKNIDSLKERMARDKEEIKNLSKSNTDFEKEIEKIRTEHNLVDEKTESAPLPGDS